jgi:hypothetical protein
MVHGDPVPLASADSPQPYLIAPYEGQTVDLEFAVGPSSPRDAFIDDIRFLPIPEPSTVGLLALGSCC